MKCPLRNATAYGSWTKVCPRPCAMPDVVGPFHWHLIGVRSKGCHHRAIDEANRTSQRIQTSQTRPGSLRLLRLEERLSTKIMVEGGHLHDPPQRRPELNGATASETEFAQFRQFISRHFFIDWNGPLLTEVYLFWASFEMVSLAFNSKREDH